MRNVGIIGQNREFCAEQAVNAAQGDCSQADSRVIPFEMEWENGTGISIASQASHIVSKVDTHSTSHVNHAGITGKGVKFNLHLIEGCNYRCRHCYAKFNSRKVLSFDNWKTIVDNCIDAVPDCSFNIAGGEPLLAPYFHGLAEYCHGRGRKVSVITNGSMITDKWIAENAPLLDTVGLSLDSFNAETLIRMGRCTRSGKILTPERIGEITRAIKEVNPVCSIKVNTVVCALNKNETVRDNILDIPVSRWKIFKMMNFANESFNNYDIGVSEDEYMHYIRNNLGLSAEQLSGMASQVFKLSDSCSVVVEKNLDGGYLMIDACGDLVDNTKNTNYVPVVNCITGSVSDGLNRLEFNSELYWSRYRDCVSDMSHSPGVI